MKQIELTQGKFALVDDEDYIFLNQWKWCTQKSGKTYYAIRGLYVNGKKIATLRMHRVLLSIPSNMEGDHIDHNGLNNQRRNLRICTHAQNMCNQPSNKNSSSKYLGVTLNKQVKSKKKWRSQIRFNGAILRMGSYSTQEEAAGAYNKKAEELFGEFANLNKIQ
jgi:hypothetical protein